MILNKFRRLVHEFRIREESLKLQNAELDWANIFHDTIKDKKWITNLAISPGRWACNYSFLYILVRILSDYKPQRILEFGLGETSKVVSSFLSHDLQDSSHLAIEQDTNWIQAFNQRFSLAKNSTLLHLPLDIKFVKGYPVTSYNQIEKNVNGVFDLYIIDGPYGSDNYSRYDICLLAERLLIDSEFIIIIDDYDRHGEKQTVTDLFRMFEKKGIKVFTGIYSGNKSQAVIVTKNYKYCTSM